MLQFAQVCLEKKLDLGNALLVLLGGVGLFSIYVTYRQLLVAQNAQREQILELQQSSRAQQVQILLTLYEDFIQDEDRRKFIQRLDYTKDIGKPDFKPFEFNPKIFRGSEDERHLDILLYRLAFVGLLVESKDIKPTDLGWLNHGQ